MPEIRVTDEQGNVHVFPDGSTPEMISRAMGLKSAPQPQAQQPQSQDTPWYQTAGEILQKPAEFNHDVNVGFLKGAGQTVATVAKGINKLPVVGKYLSPSEGIGALEQLSQPKGVGQHIGAIGESMAEMAATGAPLRKGAMLIAGGAKLAAPIARAAAEAINTGANAGLHGQDVGTGAAFGAGGSLIGEALPLIAKPLKNAAINQYNKFLNPTKEATKNIAEDVTPELIRRGEVAISGPSLEARAANKTANLGQQIDAAVSKVPANVKPETKPVIDALEKYKQSFIVNGTPINEAGVANAEKLQEMVSQLGPNISYQSLNRVRQILDSTVAKGGGYVGKTLADGATIDAQREAANAIRKELSRQAPDIAKINAEFHFWRQVEDVVGATNARRVGQQGGLGRVLGPIIGGGGGLAHGGIEGAASGAALMFIANEVVRSPAWRTVSAVVKDRMANAIASGDVAKAAVLLGRIGSSSQNSLRTPDNQLPTGTSGQMR